MSNNSIFQCLIDAGLITEAQASVINKIPANYAQMISAGLAVAGSGGSVITTTPETGTITDSDVLIKVTPGQRYSLLVGYGTSNFAASDVTPLFTPDTSKTLLAGIPPIGQYLTGTPIAFTAIGILEFVAADEYLILSPGATMSVPYVLTPIS